MLRFGMRIAAPSALVIVTALAAGCGAALRSSGAASHGGSTSARESHAVAPPARGPAYPLSGDLSHPALQATLEGAVIHEKPRFGLPRVTVTFTIHEPGKGPDTKIPFGSYFQMLLYDKAGRPGPSEVRANCTRGRCTATTFLPAGGIGSVTVGGWLNFPTGQPTARGGYLIPVTVVSTGL
jgi:hypothetical protein